MTTSKSKLEKGQFKLEEMVNFQKVNLPKCQPELFGSFYVWVDFLEVGHFSIENIEFEQIQAN
jgi:hypothetical protein